MNTCKISYFLSLMLEWIWVVVTLSHAGDKDRLDGGWRIQQAYAL